MNNLKLIREIYDATQSEVATALGVNRVTILAKSLAMLELMVDAANDGSIILERTVSGTEYVLEL